MVFILLPCACFQTKKGGGTTTVKKPSAAREAKSPDSSVSSNPSSPVSSTRSSPHRAPVRSRQTTLSKLQSARAVSHEQKLKSTKTSKRSNPADDADFTGSPASSKHSSSFSSPSDASKSRSKNAEKTSSAKHAPASAEMYYYFMLFGINMWLLLVKVSCKLQRFVGQHYSLVWVSWSEARSLTPP